MTKYIVLTGLADEMIDPTLPPSSDPTGPLYGLNGWLQAGIAAEPDDATIAGDLSKRGPITRWLGYAFGQPRITHTAASALLPLEPGDPNPFFQIIDAISREQGEVRLGTTPTSPASAEPVTRDIWKTPEYAMALVLTGGDAINLPVFFGVTDTAATCPFDASKTWAEYYAAYTPKVSGGIPYYENLYAGAGYIPASVWFGAYYSGAMTVISKQAYIDLVDDFAEA